MSGNANSVSIDRLGSVNEYEAGEGTFVKDNIIYASILGSKVISKDDCRFHRICIICSFKATYHDSIN